MSEANAKAPLRVLIVDDSAFNRRSIADILSSVPEIEVVGKAADGEEALRLITGLRPDVITLDLEMPRMDGLELTRRLKGHATLRSLPVVIVTTRGGDADRRRGMEAGADGYVAKGDLVRQDLVDVVSRLLG